MVSDCDLGSPLPFFPSFIRSNKQRGVWGHPSLPAPPALQGVLMHLCVYNGSLWPESKLSQEPHILGLGHCPQGRQAIKMNTEQISNLLFKFVWKNILFPLCPGNLRLARGDGQLWGPRPERCSVSPRKQSWWQDRSKITHFQSQHCHMNCQGGLGGFFLLLPEMKRFLIDTNGEWFKTPPDWCHRHIELSRHHTCLKNVSENIKIKWEHRVESSCLSRRELVLGLWMSLPPRGLWRLESTGLGMKT